MLARFLHNTKVRYSYENHRSKTYQETTCGVGIHRALRLQAVYAETKPYNIGQSRWHALKEDSGKAVVLGTQGQPLGQTVSRQDVAKPTRQYKARLMYNNRTVLDGAANITQITNHSVKLQLLGQLAMHNSNDKEDRVYIDELDLGNFAMDLAPEVYGKTATGPAFAYGRTDGRNTLGVDSWANDPNKPIQFYPCRNTSVDAVANDWAAEVNAAGTGLMISWIPCKWREGLCRPQRQPSGVTIVAILFSDAGMAVIMFFLLITVAPLLFGGSTCMRHASSRSRAMRSTSS